MSLRVSIIITIAVVRHCRATADAKNVMPVMSPEERARCSSARAK